MPSRSLLQTLLRRLLPMIVAISLLPGMGELLESVEHLVHDGHLPHSALHEQSQHVESEHNNDEHGCTPLSHQCDCHASFVAVLQRLEFDLEPSVWVSESEPESSLKGPSSWANAPPVPPAIS